MTEEEYIANYFSDEAEGRSPGRLMLVTTPWGEPIRTRLISRETPNHIGRSFALPNHPVYGTICTGEYHTYNEAKNYLIDRMRQNANLGNVRTYFSDGGHGFKIADQYMDFSRVTIRLGHPHWLEILVKEKAFSEIPILLKADMAARATLHALMFRIYDNHVGLPGFNAELKVAKLRAFEDLDYIELVSEINNPHWLASVFGHSVIARPDGPKDRFVLQSRRGG